MNVVVQNFASDVDFRSSLAVDSDTAAKYFRSRRRSARLPWPPAWPE
jgi:hypothetical protein